MEKVLNTKLSELNNLSLNELEERQKEIQAYIELVVLNIENHPSDFTDNRLRRSEVSSMRAIGEVFQARINELKPLDS